MILFRVQSIIYHGKLTPLDVDPGVYVQQGELKELEIFTHEKWEGIYFVGRDERYLTGKYPNIGRIPAYVFASFDSEEEAKDYVEQQTEYVGIIQNSEGLLDVEEAHIRFLNLKTREEVDVYYRERYPRYRAELRRIFVDCLCRRLGITEEGNDFS